MFSRSIFLIVVFAAGMFAQAPYGRVRGRVVDSAGAVVPSIPAAATKKVTIRDLFIGKVQAPVAKAPVS